MSKQVTKIISCVVVVLFILSYQGRAFASQNDTQFLGTQTLATKQPPSNGLLFSEEELDALAKRNMKRIGILTGGGLAPGHNAVIAAVVKAAAAKGIEVVGIRRGWEGLYRDDLIQEALRRGPLSVEEVTKTERKGGSILRTSRFNPFKNQGETEKAEIMLKNMKEKLELDAIIACGGDDTCTAAKELTSISKQLGYNQSFLALPKTIDNDLNIPAEANTYGFRTFTNKGIMAANAAKETAMSTNAIRVMEVMGRSAGHIALRIGAEAKASFTIIPEEDPVDLEQLITQIEQFYKKYKYALIIVAEGAHLQYKGNEITFDMAPSIAMDMLNAARNASVDSFGHKKLQYVGQMMTYLLQGYFGYKSTGESYVKYAGKVSYGARAQEIARTDLEMCTVLGETAVEYLIDGKDNRLLYVVEKRARKRSEGIAIAKPLEEEHDGLEKEKNIAYRVKLQVQDIDLSTDPDLRGRIAKINSGEKDSHLFKIANLGRFDAPGASRETFLRKEIRPDIWEGKLLTTKSKDKGCHRIGILTGGDLLPGFNTIIASIIRQSQKDKNKHQVVGIYEGWRGLIREHLVDETIAQGIVKDVSEELLTDIEKRGGSILRTSNLQLHDKKNYSIIAKNIKLLGIDTLIVCGGSRTTKSAQQLHAWLTNNGINTKIIVVPKVVAQIDGKDVAAVAYGYRTFVERGKDEASSLKIESEALNRVMVVTIDQKNDGFAALRIGADIGATFTFTPETEPIDLKDLIARLQEYYNEHGSGVVIATQGARLLKNYRSNDIYLNNLFEKYPEMKTFYETSFGDRATYDTKGQFIGEILAKILDMNLKPLKNSQEKTVATYGDKIGVFARSQRVLPEDAKIAAKIGKFAYRFAVNNDHDNKSVILYVPNGDVEKLPIETSIGARPADIRPGGLEYVKYQQANQGLFDKKEEITSLPAMIAA